MSDHTWWNHWGHLGAHWRMDHGMTWTEIGNRLKRDMRKGSDSRNLIERIMAQWRLK